MKPHINLERVRKVVRRGGGRGTMCPGCEQAITASQRTIVVRGVPWHRSCALRRVEPS
jgi:hypothetical protein